MDELIIAIDGPAGSGKSSVAQGVAARLGMANVNTGAAYRAVAFAALQDGLNLDDGPALARAAAGVSLSGDGAVVDGALVPEEKLRSPEVSAAASKVSARPEVREVLLAVQREAAKRAARSGGAVVEGRDIGTVVLPDAGLKIFLSASADERARRRAVQRGKEAELERIRTAMQVRDRQDTERQAAPLKPADEAVALDTTDLTLDEVVEKIADLAFAARREC